MEGGGSIARILSDGAHAQRKKDPPQRAQRRQKGGDGALHAPKGTDDSVTSVSSVVDLWTGDAGLGARKPSDRPHAKRGRTRQVSIAAGCHVHDASVRNNLTHAAAPVSAAASGGVALGHIHDVKDRPTRSATSERLWPELRKPAIYVHIANISRPCSRAEGSGGEAAVGDQLGAGDERGLGAGEIGDGAGDLLETAAAAHPAKPGPRL